MPFAARRKGWLQEGADADIVAFDPQTVADRVNFPGKAIALDPGKRRSIHHP
jgi:dihydroorotase-like cyclic amidohydrolase